MEENIKVNLFEQAIEKEELLEFSIGDKDYFIEDREYGGHWVLGSWTNYILPFINKKGENIANHILINLFKSILNSEILEIEKKGDILLYHLHVYYYQRQEGKIQSDALTIINNDLQLFLDDYIEFLLKSKSDKIDAVQNAINLIKSRGGLLK